MSNKKYFWLKLKEDFFEEDTLQWLEEQENGKEYCLFYLKLCLKSLKSNGVLIRNVGQMLVPYDAKKLSEITRTDIDTVRVAMGVFEQIGLVQKLENGEIFITQLENMVGSESKWAEKKRLQRQKKDNVPQIEGQSPIEIEKEIEKELEIENKEIYIEIISYLNESANTKYKSTSSKTRRLINARLKEGFLVDDFKTVIDNKVREWINDDKMNKFIRPETLFSNKFEGYLNQKEVKLNGTRTNGICTPKQNTPSITDKFADRQRELTDEERRRASEELD